MQNSFFFQYLSKRDTTAMLYMFSCKEWLKYWNRELQIAKSQIEVHVKRITYNTN